MVSSPELRVLHVDDDDHDAEIVGRMLRELADTVEVVRARDGADGLTRLATALDTGRPLPDIVVLDLVMPVLNGEEFLEALRADRRFDEVPVIVLTQERDLQTLKRLSRCGAQAALSKDLRDEEFLHLKQFVIDLWFHGYADPLSREIAWLQAA